MRPAHSSRCCSWTPGLRPRSVKRWPAVPSHGLRPLCSQAPPSSCPSRLPRPRGPGSPGTQARPPRLPEGSSSAGPGSFSPLAQPALVLSGRRKGRHLFPQFWRLGNPHQSPAASVSGEGPPAGAGLVISQVLAGGRAGGAPESLLGHSPLMRTPPSWPNHRQGCPTPSHWGFDFRP